MVVVKRNRVPGDSFSELPISTAAGESTVDHSKRRVMITSYAMPRFRFLYRNYLREKLHRKIFY